MFNVNAYYSLYIFFVLKQIKQTYSTYWELVIIVFLSLISLSLLLFVCSDLLSDVAVSHCGLSEDLTEECFAQSQVSFSEFCSNPELLGKPNTVIRIGGKYVSHCTCFFLLFLTCLYCCLCHVYYNFCCPTNPTRFTIGNRKCLYHCVIDYLSDIAFIALVCLSVSCCIQYTCTCTLLYTVYM